MSYRLFYRALLQKRPVIFSSKSTGIYVYRMSLSLLSLVSVSSLSLLCLFPLSSLSRLCLFMSTTCLSIGASHPITRFRMPIHLQLHRNRWNRTLIEFGFHDGVGLYLSIKFVGLRDHPRLSQSSPFPWSSCCEIVRVQWENLELRKITWSWPREAPPPRTFARRYSDWHLETDCNTLITQYQAWYLETDCNTLITQYQAWYLEIYAIPRMIPRKAISRGSRRQHTWEGDAKGDTSKSPVWGGYG